MRYQYVPIVGFDIYFIIYHQPMTLRHDLIHADYKIIYDE